jgi:hypothetical protein
MKYRLACGETFELEAVPPTPEDIRAKTRHFRVTLPGKIQSITVSEKFLRWSRSDD